MHSDTPKTWHSAGIVSYQRRVSDSDNPVNGGLCCLMLLGNVNGGVKVWIYKYLRVQWTHGPHLTRTHWLQALHFSSILVFCFEWLWDQWRYLYVWCHVGHWSLVSSMCEIPCWLEQSGSRLVNTLSRPWLEGLFNLAPLPPLNPARADLLNWCVTDTKELVSFEVNVMMNVITRTVSYHENTV